jgi:hypothetical protein
VTGSALVAARLLVKLKSLLYRPIDPRALHTVFFHGAGINIAQTPWQGQKSNDSLGEAVMKELANGLAQLAAIIMILVTLAVSMAAVSQWASGGGEATAAQPETIAVAR